jgi:hypothetical protein
MYVGIFLSAVLALILGSNTQFRLFFNEILSIFIFLIEVSNKKKKKILKRVDFYDSNKF